MDPFANLGLALLALGAALVNGAVGYGFSSIVTPIALLWYSNRVLNPALVTVELVVNLTLLVRERRLLRATWGHARPVIQTLLPGVVLGTLGLTYLAINDVKFVVYAALLPLAALQLWGFARPIRNEARGGLVVGTGIGFLYSLTTISGPPLAVFFRNQGLSKGEFRATMAQVRFAESSLTLGVYFLFSQYLGAGLVAIPSLSLIPYLALPVIVGVPLGTLLLKSVSPEFFRRFVVAIDGAIVSYGLSKVMVSLGWVTPEVSYLTLGVLFSVIVALAWLSLSRISGATMDEEFGRLPPGSPPADAGPRTSVPAVHDPP